MAVNTTPVFPIIDKTNSVKISTANAGINPAGSITDLVTFTKKGRLNKINFKAEASTTAGMLRVWHKLSGTYYLLSEILVPAITIGANTASFERSYCLNDKYAAGAIIGVSTEKAESFACTGYWNEDEI